MNDYNLKIKDLYKKYKTSENGISEEEAAIRLEKNGENKLKEAKKKSYIIMFLSQFNDFMVILLICAALFSAIVSYIRGESYLDSIIIFIIVIINAILSFIQERKADVAVSELNKLFVTNTFVIRNGKKESIDVKNIVVGDIIELEAGDYISADCRVIKSEALEVNESTLTGESISIKKNGDDIDGDRELYERTNMVFSGCNVTNGHALVLVVSTGMNTELGHIANSLLNKKNDITPLQKKINQVSKILTYVVLAIIIIMMLFGLMLKNDFFDILMLSISLAVAAIPEGLSSIITIILSIGMSSMAKKNVIIRKMESVETLGSTDVICSDKTGTITQNKMLVKQLMVNDMLYSEKDEVNNSKLFMMCSYFCHNVVKSDDKYLGDETEIAIYKYLENLNISFKGKRVHEYPFDSDRKMMSVVYEIDGDMLSFTKGSLDSVINNCSKYLKDNKLYSIDENYKKKIFDIENQLSHKSLRLLALAYKNSDVDNPEKNMVFLGIIGMMDPPRDTVEGAIKICRNAGIKPIMITGDSINTARAIAIDVGIIDNEDKAIEGKKVDKMSDEELVRAVNYYQVYARISPNTKLRIVESLQSQGLVVAMTGDGVNDAPAIQKADIGIGMGITGTEVVKKVADCILIDDSFSTIVDGVHEGRRITNNIKKVMIYLLVGNIIEVILVFVSMLLNMEMFTTLQLLWINLVTDSIPAIMLAFEKSDDDIMNNDLANKGNTTFFTPFLTSKLVIGAFLKSIIMLILFLIFSKIQDSNTAGSLLFIFLVFHELLFSFSCRNLKKSVLNKSIFDNKRLTIGIAVILSIQLIILFTGLSNFFIVKGIKSIYIIITVLLCIITFILGELVKPLYVKFFKDYVGGDTNEE